MKEEFLTITNLYNSLGNLIYDDWVEYEDGFDIHCYQNDGKGKFLCIMRIIESFIGNSCIEFKKNIQIREIDDCINDINGSINYFQPFLNEIPIIKESVIFLLKKGRRLIDENPKGKDNLIISEYQFDGRNVIRNREVKVNNNKNLINYFTLRNEFKTRGIKDFEINLLIDKEFAGSAWVCYDEPIILEGEIKDDGYMSAYLYNGRNDNERYYGTFYIKSQIDNFIPQTKFIKYSDVVIKWENICNDSSLNVSSLILSEMSNLTEVELNSNIFMMDRGIIDINELKNDSYLFQKCVFDAVFIQELEQKHLPEFNDNIVKESSLNDDYLADNKENKINSLQRIDKLELWINSYKGASSLYEASLKAMLDLYRLDSNTKFEACDIWNKLKSTSPNDFIIKVLNDSIEWKKKDGESKSTSRKAFNTNIVKYRQEIREKINELNCINPK